jgi:glycosyltransferase involved in cell wall biosynthesis
VRLLAHLVARNEARRYLQAVLSALPTSEIHLYDDGSIDDTVNLAIAAGAKVSHRPRNVPSFVQDEGAFRQAAWWAFVVRLQPQPGDWVLAVDCDEVLVAADGDVEGSLRRAIERAEADSCIGVELPIPEAWEIRGNGLWVRTDGFWGQLSAPRLFGYKEGGTFARRRMGCGSAPLYVTEGRLSREVFGISLVHLGYVDPEDRKEKHRRYRSMANSGHNSAHIKSILQPADLKPLGLPAPTIWKGRR